MKTKLVFKCRTNLPLGNSDETHLQAAATQPRRRLYVHHTGQQPGRARKVLHGHSASTCPCGCSIFALRLTKNDRLPTDGGVQLATKPIALLRFFGRAKFIFRNLFQNLDAKPPRSHCCFPLSGTFGAQGQGEAWLLPGPPHEGGRQDTDQPGILGLSLLICP